MIYLRAWVGELGSLFWCKVNFPPQGVEVWTARILNGRLDEPGTDITTYDRCNYWSAAG